MAFGNDALGVICSESGMNAKYLVHYVNDLFRDRLILSAGDPGECSSEGDRSDQKRVLSHGMTLLWIGASPSRADDCLWPIEDIPLTKPTTGMAGCCARAGSGHAAAPPPTGAKCFRRPMLLAM